MRISLSKIKTLFFIPWLSFLSVPFIGAKGACYLFIGICAAGIIFIALRRVGQVRLGGKITKELTTPKLSYNPKYFIAVSMLFVLVLPLWADNYYIDVAVLAGIYIILAIGLNVIIGYAGLLNLGFAAFYAIGAYSSALLTTALGLGFWSALFVSLILTTFSGFLLAFPALRLRGDYLAIITLGFGEITRLTLNNWDKLTHGPNGISGIPVPFIFGFELENLKHYYYVVLFFVLLAVIVVRRAYYSRIGRAWLAIREDETAAEAMGVDATRYKFLAFSFGAFWAGLAGALFASKMRFVSPESFSFMESVFIACMVILGGLGSIPGVILGSLILVVLPEALRDFQSYRMLALGAGLILMMIFRPQGIIRSRE